MVDYTFYTENYHAKMIPELDFCSVTDHAEDILAYYEREYTVTGTQEQRDKAICAIAEVVYSKEQAASAALGSMTGDGGVINSESIGSVSESYKQITPADYGFDFSSKGTQSEIYKLIRRYLTVYRGVC